MHLVVDIGNTETVLGLVDPRSGELEAHWRLTTGTSRTADEMDHMVHSLLARKGYDATRLERAVLGSVVPSINGRMKVALEGLIAGPVYTVEPGEDLPVRLDVDEPQTVGADRIVNTLAAKILYQRDTIVVDLGTATTFDCITANGVFMGGVIAPGVQVGMEWLGRRAAKLPRVQFRRPQTVIGRRTESCMESGVFFSTVDAIDGLVRRIQEEWERPDALVVATGGYAELMAQHCETVAQTEPFLTLKGLFFAGKHLAGDQ
jgi:type III pantothenate kinase